MAALSLVGLLVLQSPAAGQRIKTKDFHLEPARQPADVPAFGVEMFNTLSDLSGFSRLKVQLTFVNDELQFIKFKKKSFRADFEARVVFLDTTGNEVDRAKWSGHVDADNFDETNSTIKRNTTSAVLDLPPGFYRFKVELTDKETRRTGKREGTVTVRDFSSDKLLLSDIVFVDSLSAERVADATRPAGSGAAADLYAYFEVYNVPESDTIDVSYQVVGPQDTVVQQGRMRFPSKGRVTGQWLKLDQHNIADGKHRFSLFAKALDQTLHAEQTIQCNCPDSQPLFEDLDQAIEVLVYIAKKDEFKKLKAATGEERIRLFNEFWKKRDPTPKTRYNEYMEEYYKRVRFVNEKFRGGKTGWRTDMGMVFIKLGPPDYVDKPFNYNNYLNRSFNNRPLIVWNYLDYHRRVIFRYDIGEYRIANYSEVFDLLNGEMRF